MRQCGHTADRILHCSQNADLLGHRDRQVTRWKPKVAYRKLEVGNRPIIVCGRSLLNLNKLAP